MKKMVFFWIIFCSVPVRGMEEVRRLSKACARKKEYSNRDLIEMLAECVTKLGDQGDAFIDRARKLAGQTEILFGDNDELLAGIQELGRSQREMRENVSSSGKAVKKAQDELKTLKAEMATLRQRLLHAEDLIDRQYEDIRELRTRDDSRRQMRSLSRKLSVMRRHITARSEGIAGQVSQGFQSIQEQFEGMKESMYRSQMAYQEPPLACPIARRLEKIVEDDTSGVLGVDYEELS